jgi:hypothetical protein
MSQFIVYIAADRYYPNSNHELEQGKRNLRGDVTKCIEVCRFLLKWISGY